MITYTPPPLYRKRPIGCGGVMVVLAGIAICIWLTFISGFGTALLQNKPLLIIPLPGHQTLALAHPSSDTTYHVMGKPSLSPAFINQVLAQAHSPAMGTGQALYDLSLRSGIDDAYALAFFAHESAYGTTGVARVTHSLGNIKCSQGYTCLSGYRIYTSWQQGYADWYALIRTLYVGRWHLVTIPQIVPVYAPAFDGNDPAAYIAAVEQHVSSWRQGNAAP